MFRPIVIATVLTAITAATGVAGPPWISVEYPANPHHASTRDATLLVRTYHHSSLISVPVQGIAEGIVDGKRVSMQLDVRTTNLPGVYAVRTNLPKRGTWVLALTLTESKSSTATALVTVDNRGRVVAVDVPSEKTKDGWMVPRDVGRGDIEAALRSAVAADDDADRHNAPLAGLLVLPLLLAGGAWRARRNG